MAKKFNIIPEIDELVMKVVMRYVWPSWRGKKEALARAAYYCVENGRRRRFWICEECGKDRLGPMERQTDHISPRTPVDGYDELNSWLKRTLCEANQLRILCLDCHKKKSAEEAGQRAEVRRAAKAKSRKKKGKRK